MGAIIDFVKWDTRPDEQLFAWKFPETNLSTYTQLVVAESQEAILFPKDKSLENLDRANIRSTPRTYRFSEQCSEFLSVEKILLLPKCGS